MKDSIRDLREGKEDQSGGGRTALGTLERREGRPKQRLKDSIRDLGEKGRKTKAEVEGQHQRLREKGRKTKAEVEGQHRASEREGKEDQSGG